MYVMGNGREKQIFRKLLVIRKFMLLKYGGGDCLAAAAAVPAKAAAAAATVAVAVAEVEEEEEGRKSENVCLWRNSTSDPYNPFNNIA